MAPARAKDKAKRERFRRWIEQDLASQFDGRILPFDQEAAVIWGEIMGDGDRLGRPKPMADAQIAAVARRHNLTLATRNTRDFAGMNVGGSRSVDVGLMGRRLLEEDTKTLGSISARSSPCRMPSPMA